MVDGTSCGAVDAAILCVYCLRVVQKLGCTFNYVMMLLLSVVMAYQIILCDGCAQFSQVKFPVIIAQPNPIFFCSLSACDQRLRSNLHSQISFDDVIIVIGRRNHDDSIWKICLI